MENTSDLKKGDIVYIKSLTQTFNRYKLDGTGHMEKMKGKYFPIKEISGATALRIYHEKARTTFIFDVQDLDRREPEPLEPKIFEFDPQHLDI